MILFGVILFAVVFLDALVGDGWACAGVVAAAFCAPSFEVVLFMAALKLAFVAGGEVGRLMLAAGTGDRASLPRPNLAQREAALDRESDRLDRQIDRCG